MKDWFKARKSWYGMTAGLSSAELGRLWSAVLKYVNTGEIDELTGSEKGCFTMIIWTLQQDETQEHELSAKRKQSGRLGGLKRVEANSSKRKQNQANASFASPTPPSFTTTSKYDPVNIPLSSNVEDMLLSNDKILPPISPHESSEAYYDGAAALTDQLNAMGRQKNAAGYLTECGFELTSNQWEKFRDFMEMLPDSVLIHGIDESVGSTGKKRFATLQRILDRYVSEGVDDVESARNSDEKFISERRDEIDGKRRNAALSPNSPAGVTRETQQAYRELLKPRRGG